MDASAGPDAPDGTGTSTSTGAAEGTATPLRGRQIRKAIAESAFRLATEQGLDAVTVDQIAKDACVSRRTFFNYFPTKAAAVMPRSFPVPTTAVEELLQDTSTPDLPAVCRFLVACINETRGRQQAFDQLHELLRTEASLRVEVQALLTNLEEYVALLVARRAGTPPGSLRDRTVAAVAVATFRVAIERWEVHDSAEHLEDEVLGAFRTLLEASTEN